MMEGRAPVRSLTGINQGMGTHSLEALHKLEISLVAQMVKNLPAMQETQVRALGWEDPLGKGVAAHSSILAWSARDRGAWWATLHEVAKSWTWLND